VVLVVVAGLRAAKKRSTVAGEGRGVVLGWCLLSVAWLLGCCWRDCVVLVVGSDLRAA
jgi:hypothetical protein